MDNNLNYDWVSSELMQYVLKQRDLLERAIAVFKKSAALLEEEFKNGNDYEIPIKPMHKRGIEKEVRLPKESGEGYLLREDSFKISSKIREANKHFLQRVLHKFEELNGPLKDYTDPNNLLEEYYEEPVDVALIFNWINNHLTGEALKEVFSKNFLPEEIVVVGRKLTVKPSKENEDFPNYVNKMYYDNDYYEVDAEILIEALIHFEGVPTTEAGQILEAQQIIWKDKVSKETLKQKWELSGFNKTESIRFFANGRLDITFAIPEYAEVFSREYLRFRNL